MTYAARAQSQLERRGEPRELDKPRPGYWMLRVVKNGPLVPAAIFLRPYVEETDEPDASMERHPHYEAFIGGESVPVEKVWHRKGEPITEREYLYQLSDQAWARQYAPDEPKAQSQTPINHLTVKPPF
jgi:hypothetical protein